jgi:hypothetical protein
MKCLKWFKKQRLLKLYHKDWRAINNHLHLIRNFHWSKEDIKFFNNYFNAEVRCYNRLKKL